MNNYARSVALIAGFAGATYGNVFVEVADADQARTRKSMTKTSYKREVEQTAVSAAIIQRQHDQIAKRFLSLAERWKEDTWFMSNADNIAKHPAYQEIIRMGKAAIPLILGEMQREPDHWFWALNLITDFDPVHNEHAGDVEAMTQDWLKWGKKHGYI